MEQLNPGYLEKLDVVQIAFLLLVAGNATIVSMIYLVGTKATPGAILFETIPGLRLAVPKQSVKWTPATKDVRILELPVMWEFSSSL
ncbi:hypothetical protein AnigIFM56816_009812 [Aspergillus niger]|nr:hypothetical protein AnigIFM56816_009812 [Aspergillus niger]